MKFNPEDWSETHAEVWHKARKGWLRVRCATPCALYVASETGIEALVGVGTSFDVETAQAVSWRVDAVNGNALVRVFVYSPPSTSFVAEGERFTNIDRMPSESGNLSEVTRAMRLFELQRRAAIREIRAERDALVFAKAKDQEAGKDEQSDEQAGDDAGAEDQEAKA